MKDPRKLLVRELVHVLGFTIKDLSFAIGCSKSTARRWVRDSDVKPCQRYAERLTMLRQIVWAFQLCQRPVPQDVLAESFIAELAKWLDTPLDEFDGVPPRDQIRFGTLMFVLEYLLFECIKTLAGKETAVSSCFDDVKNTEEV